MRAGSALLRSPSGCRTRTATLRRSRAPVTIGLGMPSPISNPMTPQQLRQRAGCVCVALSGPEMLRHAATAIRQTPFIEFRLDSLPRPTDFVPQISRFLAENPHVTAIATCRRTAYGGGYRGAAREQLEILKQSAAAGCLLVDIEVETAEELGAAALSELRQAGSAVIVSWHDFAGTPPLEPGRGAHRGARARLPQDCAHGAESA